MKRARAALGLFLLGVLGGASAGACGRLGYELGDVDGGSRMDGRAGADAMPSEGSDAGPDGQPAPDGGGTDGSLADGAPRADGGTRVLSGCSGGASPDCQCLDGERCTGVCSAASCAFECQSGSTCDVQCRTGAQCEVACEDGAMCTLSCSDAMVCRLHCGGAVCSGGGDCPGCG